MSVAILNIPAKRVFRRNLDLLDIFHLNFCIVLLFGIYMSYSSCEKVNSSNHNFLENGFIQFGSTDLDSLKYLYSIKYPAHLVAFPGHAVGLPTLLESGSVSRK